MSTTHAERGVRFVKFVWALFAVAMGLVALPRAAFALKAPLCGGISCTGNGGKPSFQSNGARGLSHPEIVPIFWGTHWNGTSSPTRGQMLGNLQALANGAYFAALSQYGGSTGDTVGPVRVTPTAPTFTGTNVAAPKCLISGASCTIGGAACSDGSACDVPFNAVQTTIETLIANGSVPGPAANTDMLYVVFVDSSKSQADWNIGRSCSSACGSKFAGNPYNMALVAGDSAGLAHELVEAISNNVSNSNCVYAGTTSSANQIADVCSCYNEQQMVGSSNPITVPAYWSKADASCVIPEGWDGIWSYDLYSWTQITAQTVRQVYAGKYGLYATDTNDNLFDASTSTVIGGPGAMFAVGNASVVGLSPDASGVWAYDSAGWTAIGGGATSIYAGGPHKVATDYNGNPWAYSSGGTWSAVGGPSTQFALNEGGLVGLDLDHASVWRSPNANASGWVQIGGSASEIFVGMDNGVGKVARSASRNVWYYSGSGTSWFEQGGPGNTFAITMDGFLFGLNPARTGVFFTPYNGTTDPPWVGVGGAAGKLVQRSFGGNLYATGVVKY
jgi:hypothetical protein